MEAVMGSIRLPQFNSRTRLYFFLATMIWLALYIVSIMGMNGAFEQGDLGIIPLTPEEETTIIKQEIPNAPTVWAVGSLRWGEGEEPTKLEKSLTKYLAGMWDRVGIFNVNPEPVTDINMDIYGPSYIALAILFADKEDATAYKGVAYSLHFVDPAGNLHEVTTVFTEDKITPKNYNGLLEDLDNITKAFAYAAANHWAEWREDRQRILQNEGMLNHV
jgi:hypothetical protein